MSYELITDAEYASLPLESRSRFAAFEAIVRARMTELSMETQSAHTYSFIQMQYMSMVAGAADALNIPGVRYPDHLNDPSEGINEFMHSVSRQVASIKLSPSSAGEARVLLEQGSRTKLEQQIQRLKTMILTSDLPEAKKRNLLEHLEDARTELSQHRVSLAKIAAVIALIAYGLNEGTQFLAEAPHAIATIYSILGHDKQTETEAQKRLAPPHEPRALPAPESSRPVDRNRQIAGRQMIDDDIPF